MEEGPAGPAPQRLAQAISPAMYDRFAALSRSLAFARANLFSSA